MAVGRLAGLISGVALLAPVLPLEDPTQRRAGRPVRASRSPTGSARIGWAATCSPGPSGGRISIVVAVFAIAFGMLVGGSLGMLAGFLKGKVDQVISFVFFVILSFPGLVLAILIVTSFERNLRTVAFTLGVLSVAPVGRLARAQTLVYADREFVPRPG
ncbi:MAG: ABC transporter permease subunit [Acidimicrobiales bacterium]